MNVNKCVKKLRTIIMHFAVSERDIPVQENVRGVCEILGLDPLFLANEGKMVLSCPKADAQIVLAAMKNQKYGQNAAIIGSFDKGCVMLKTSIGGERIVGFPTGGIVFFSNNYPQIVNLDENAGFQSVINTILSCRQTSATHSTFCGQVFLDIQDWTSYSLTMKKQCLINFNSIECQKVKLI